MGAKALKNPYWSIPIHDNMNCIKEENNMRFKSIKAHSEVNEMKRNSKKYRWPWISTEPSTPFLNMNMELI